MIIIAFYRDKDGKIVRHHDARGHTLEEMEKLAEKYNQKREKNGQTVYVEAVEDNSLMAYLFRKAEERKKHNTGGKCHNETYNLRSQLKIT